MPTDIVERMDPGYRSDLSDHRISELDARLATHFARQQARIDRRFTEQLQLMYVGLLVQAALIFLLVLK